MTTTRPSSLFGHTEPAGPSSSDGWRSPPSPSGNWPQASEAADACLALAHPTDQPELLAHGEAAAGIVAAVEG